MNSSFLCYGLLGLQAFCVNVETKVFSGMPQFSVVGMAGTSVQEAKERLRSAMLVSGFQFPMKRKIVNLAPAERAKKGSQFDLPMALGLLMASGQIAVRPERLNSVMFLGELGLNGEVRGVLGAASAVLLAEFMGLKAVVLPLENHAEAARISSIPLVPISCLRDAVLFLEGETLQPPPRPEMMSASVSFPEEIMGHDSVIQALAVAATGGHSLVMNGPPGSGKSLLARAFSCLLPPLQNSELKELFRIHSMIQVGGLERLERPFRLVSSRATPVQLMGGGVDLLPGEVTLAHRGVLYLDEFPELSRAALESLRTPMEEGWVRLKRGGVQVEYPARFQLVASMNPCPCGYYGDDEVACRCKSYEVERYHQRISGPIWDRIDMRLNVPRLSFDALRDPPKTSWKHWRERVMEARERAAFRFRSAGILTNAEMRPDHVRAEPLSTECQDLLRQGAAHFHWSARAIHRIIKVARSVADLQGRDNVSADHLAEAIHCRVDI